MVLSTIKRKVYVEDEDYIHEEVEGKEQEEEMTDNELYTIVSSDATNEEKCQQLVSATSANKDNHSAWLIQIKDVETEEGDEQFVNEEPTSRCNALNITPTPPNDDEDVKIVNEDDVVVILTPPKTKSSLLEKICQKIKKFFGLNGKCDNKIV